jgi:hypothetical protein
MIRENNQLFNFYQPNYETFQKLNNIQIMISLDMAFLYPIQENSYVEFISDLIKI